MYSVHVQVKKAGPYQVRVVVRDASAEQIGSATQFIEVPDASKGRLTLSEIVLAAEPPETTPKTEGATQSEGQIAGQDANGSPAVRVFKPARSLTTNFR